MSKTLMVIAAGRYQIPTILKAKEMGLRVVATDMNPNADGFRYVDAFRVVDVKDVEGNLKVAREFSIDGVISVVSELGVRTVAQVAAQLGLPGLSCAAAEAATDKATMRRKFREAGLPSPESRVIRDKKEASSAISELGLPVVMKPTDNSGSRGVSRIDRLEDLDASLDMALRNARSGQVIVEEFVEGTELTVEALSVNSQHQVLAMSSKKRIPFPYCVSIDLTYPPPYSEKLQATVRQLVSSALDALDISASASHTEVMMADHGPVLVEVAARGGGFGIFSDIIPLVSGLDIVRECINIAMGYEARIHPSFSKAAVLRFFSLPAGKIKRITGLEEAKALPGVHEIELYVAAGDTVRPTVDDGTRHGRMITYADNREGAIRIADRVEATVKFEMA